MLTEVLKIKPKLDQGDLNQMERSLSSRFSRVAKGFGRGLKLAAVASLGAAVLDKLINPLQEVKAAIDRTLNKADDIVTNATQFNTSTENMLKIRALGNLKGLSNENVDQLLTKFQGAVAQAQQNPGDPSNSAVLNYVDEKDTALAFYNFITQLQKMDKNQQLLVQQQVFGEKQVLKMAEFLQDEGFKDATKALAKVDFKGAAVATERLDSLSKTNKQNTVVRELVDLSNKSNVMGPGTMADLNKSEIAALKLENERIGSSSTAFTVDERMAEIQRNLEKLTVEMFTRIPELFSGLNAIIELLKEASKGWQMLIQGLKGNPLMRGIKGLFGSKDGG